MHNCRPSTGSTYKWSWTPLLGIPHHISRESKNNKHRTFDVIFSLAKLKLIRGVTNPNHRKIRLHPSDRQALSVRTVCTITTPITSATQNMHKVVAHSNMIKWCVVWRHSQHLSHPSLCSGSVSCTKANTRRFPFPELCFENRSFILTVNSQADRVLTILLIVRALGGYRRSTCYWSSLSPRWSVTDHNKTPGIMRGEHVGWWLVLLSSVGEEVSWMQDVF